MVQLSRNQLPKKFTLEHPRRLLPQPGNGRVTQTAASPSDSASSGAVGLLPSSFERIYSLGEQYHSQWVLLTLISGSTACVVATGFYFREQISWLAPIFCFSFIAGVYLLNWLLETTHDFINSPSRLQVIKYKSAYWVLTSSCFVLSLGIAAYKNKLNFSLLFLFAMGLMYSVPSLPVFRKGSVIFLRLKDVTLLKSLLVALCFPLLCFETVRLFSSADMAGDSGIFWFYGGFAITTFLNTVFDDMLDIPGDEEAGIMTLPILLGAANTQRLLIGVTVVWASLLWFFHEQGTIAQNHFAPLLLQAAFPLVWPTIHHLWPKSRLLLDISIECVFWMMALALLLSRHG